MRITDVTIQVPKPGEVARFFVETFGTPRTDSEGTSTLELGRSHLILEQGDPVPDGYYHLAFDIPENTVAAALHQLRDVVPVLPAGDDGIVTASASWNAHSIYFNAPGHLNLELIARHRLRNAISTPFVLSDILNISEVGVPVDDTLNTASMLESRFGFTSFNPPSEMFAPVGDDRGLLILVKTGRIWFPTDDQPTTTRPLRIGIEGIPEGIKLGEHCTIAGPLR